MICTNTNMFFILVILSSCTSVTVLSFQKFDLSHLPFDLRPVQDLVGHWEMESVTGSGQSNVPFGKIIEFGIDPIPQFGARSLNYTAITYDDFQKSSIFNGSRVAHFEYGFLPVKNRTKANPQVLCAFLTSGSEGYSMIEFGIVEDNTVILDMNKYLARSFGLGFSGGSYQIYELQREFRVSSTRLQQTINAMTSWGKASFTVNYVKRRP